LKTHGLNTHLGKKKANTSKIRLEGGLEKKKGGKD